MNKNNRLKVMISTEGTYPFHHGGVSTWCDVLVKELSEIDYVIYSVMMNPYLTQKYVLPKNASLIKVPLWGTEDASEHLETPFSHVYMTKSITNEAVVKNYFLPLFYTLLEEIMTVDKDPIRFGFTLHNLYSYFKEYDYTISMKASITWETFKSYMHQNILTLKSGEAIPSVFDLVQSLGWLYRFFTILNTPVPKVDVCHSAAAAFCGIPCVLAKYEYGTPYLLTEHGVYLREQYLSVNRSRLSSYQKIFLMKLIQSITSVNYYMADHISPVCNYNTRWEKEFGVHSSKIKVIYNGVDKNVFYPSIKPTLNSQQDHQLTVITVARIDPVKDIESLLKAAEKVKKVIPNVRFIIYGIVMIQEYYEECLNLRNKLKLDNIVTFAGHTDDVPNVLRQADVVALSSISEAFPYSVVEAMMVGKAIVATDVGGVSEALGECGLVVTPGQYKELADALITLLQDADLRRVLGEKANKRALELFTLDRFTRMHLKVYRKLYFTRIGSIEILLLQQKQIIEKGYALLELGFWKEAIGQFKKAIKVVPDSSAVPVLLAEIAFAYTELGQLEVANLHFEKARLVTQLRENQSA